MSTLFDKISEFQTVLCNVYSKNFVQADCSDPSLKKIRQGILKPILSQQDNLIMLV